MQKCQKYEEKKCAGAVVTDFKRVQKEADLHQAVAFVGPVAVACCLPDSFKAAGYVCTSVCVCVCVCVAVWCSLCLALSGDAITIRNMAASNHYK